MAAKRVFRDLLALVAEPLPNCDVLLRRDEHGELSLDVWYILLHMHIEGEDEPLRVPFELRFPHNYPQRQPELQCMCEDLAHPCIVPSPSGNFVCLTMLDRPEPLHGGTNPNAGFVPYSGWTAAFSGHAVLMQLQGFFDEDMSTITHLSAKQLAILRAELQAYRDRVLADAVAVETLPIRRKFYAPVVQQVGSSSNASRQQASGEEQKSAGAKDDEGFILCTGRKAARINQGGSSDALRAAESQRIGAQTTTNNLQRFMCADCLQMKDASSFSKTSLTEGDQPVCLACVAMRRKKPTSSQARGAAAAAAAAAAAGAAADTNRSNLATTTGASQLTKSQLRNLRRAKKRHGQNPAQATQDGVEEQKASEETKHSPEAAKEKPQARATPQLKSFPDFITANLPRDLVVLESVPSSPNFVPTADRQTVRNAGLLGRLSNQLVQRMMLYLRPEDVINMTKTCRLFSQVGADGYIWRQMIQVYYPACRYWSEQPQDWRAIFALQTNAIHDSDLICWRTKHSHKEDELGILLRYTVNPVTKAVDYIYSDMEIVSRTAYMMHGGTASIWGERFTRWLPLYIDADHFQRSLPSILSTITALAAASTGSMSFSPSMVLDVFPKLLNTIIVLLADEATTKAQTQQLLRGYLMVHRLFIAMILRYPALRKTIRQTIADFVSHERNRVKSACPSLGEFFPLVAVSESLGWKDIGPVLIQEAFDRSVLWVCRDVPELARHRWHVQAADMELLTKVFEAGRVSYRLNAFHVCFLRILAQPTGISLGRVSQMYDSLMGVPSVHLVRRLHAALNHVIEMKSWPAFFQAVCAPVPNPVQLCNMLADSVNNSLRKGYHNLRTDFSRIQSRGVSNILLRGKSYQYSCFVIDISGSMGSRIGAHYDADNYYEDESKPTRLEAVKGYLRDALTNHLSHRDSFNIVFFDHGLHVWNHGMQQATPDNLKKALAFINRTQPSGGTDIRQAVEYAYKLPNIAAVYLLSDGEDWWPQASTEVKKWSQNGKIPCHATSFMCDFGEGSLLAEIAQASGGEFLAVKAEDFA